METKFIKMNNENPEENLVALKEAANILKNKGLVAIPTETVYGLAANALCEESAKKIYEAKGRPSDNPLIVHIAEKREVYGLIGKQLSDIEFKLIDKFWPGPLTIVFKKNKLIPKTVSGGLDTVAIRMPKNNIARAVIRECGFPLAAPSANTSTKPSPTLAKHVLEDLDGKIDMIIDGGSCGFGIESTVVQVIEDKIVILRPGSITKLMLEEFGDVEIDKGIVDKNIKAKAPGMKYKHYSPKAKVVLIKGDKEKIVSFINKNLEEDEKLGIKSLPIVYEQTAHFYKEYLTIGDLSKADTVAKNLFAVLRKCDELGLDKVYIEAFDEEEVGLAIMNRLKKAAGDNIIKV